MRLTKLRSKSRQRTSSGTSTQRDGSRPSTQLQRLRGRRRGSAFVEYIITIGLVGLVFMAAVVALGPKIVEEYQLSRNSIASPYP